MSAVRPRWIISLVRPRATVGAFASRQAINAGSSALIAGASVRQQIVALAEGVARHLLPEHLLRAIGFHPERAILHADREGREPGQLGAALTDAEGLGHRINFGPGDAEALPFDSDSFDLTLSFTVAT